MLDNTISVGSDHRGFNLKNIIVKNLIKKKMTVFDIGTYNISESVDYPDYANIVAKNIISGKTHRGILICGSGIGMSIAVNRYPEIRAALVYNVLNTELSRKHNNANVICLGADCISEKTALECINIFLKTQFEYQHHSRRIEKLSSFLNKK